MNKHIFLLTFGIFLVSQNLYAGPYIIGCETATVTATTPTEDFVIHDDDTVTHVKTGLMWKRCVEGQTINNNVCEGVTTNAFDWQEALTTAKNSTFAEYSDWRAPNVKELMSIIERQCGSPAINSTVFPNTPNDEPHFTSTYQDSETIRVIYFQNGYVGTTSIHSTGSERVVRLVRDTQ